MGNSASAAKGEASPADEAAEQEKANKNLSVAPDSEVLKTDLSSRVEISIRCEDLARSCTTFIVAYTKWSFDNHWTELGTTELFDDKEGTRCPEFKKTLTVDFKAEVQRYIRFELYKCRDANFIDMLQCQKYLGSCQMSVVEMMVARNRGNGWLMKDLEVPIHEEDTVFPGRVAVWAEEDVTGKSTVLFNMMGRDIKSTDLWKRRADPYAIINRTLTSAEGDEEVLQCTPVHRTEVVRRTREPRFKRMSITSQLLCGSKMNQDIVFEVFDWFRITEPKVVGEAVITYEELHKAFRESRPLVRPICRREGERIPVKNLGRRGTNQSGTKETTGGFSATSLSRMTGTKDSTGRSAMGTKDRSGMGTKERSGGTKERSAMGTKDKTSGRTETKDVSIASGFAQRLLHKSKDTTKSHNSGGMSASHSVGGVSMGGMSAGAMSQQSGGSRGSDGKKGYEFGTVMGQLVFEEVGVERRYTFLDYVRGGLEMKLIIAIDFTRSNQGPEVPDSLHFGDVGNLSAYATAIRAVGEAMRHYDHNDMYSAYGFGAKIPPSNTVCSDCFALTGDFSDPEVEGVEGVIEAYQRALKIVRLHGPTHIDQVIKHVAEISRPYAEAKTVNDNNVDMKFFVLMVLTDGDVHEQQKTVNELVEMRKLPVHVIVIGVGSNGEDFAFLRNLGADVKRMAQAQAAIATEDDAPVTISMREAMEGSSDKDKKKGKLETGVLTTGTRDFFDFVSFDEYHGRPIDLAAACLARLPQEITVYYGNKGVKPRGLDKYEDDGGAPLPKVVPQNPLAGRKKTNLGGSRAPTTLSVATTARTKTKDTRTTSVISGTSAFSEAPMGKSAKEQQKRLEKLPPFLKECREKLIEDAERLGYESHQINRALVDGVPASTLDCLVDNIMNAGYGKSPCYKIAARECMDAAQFRLPGQPDPSVEVMPWAPRPQTFTAGSRPTVSGSKAPSTAEGRLATSSPIGTKETSSALSKNLAKRLGQLASRSRNATKESQASGGRSSLVRSRDGTKDLAGTGGDPAERKISKGILKDSSRKESKGILKPASREPTKELRVAVAEDPNVASGEEDLGTDISHLHRSAGSKGLRQQAFVRFHDVPPTPAAEGGDKCGVCLENMVSTEFSPCGHRVACAKCAQSLGVVCPVCQEQIHEVKNLAA